MKLVRLRWYFCYTRMIWKMKIIEIGKVRDKRLRRKKEEDDRKAYGEDSGGKG